MAMIKSDIRRIAEDYVMKHKEHYGRVPKRDIKRAVEKVAKALSEIAAKDSPKKPAK